MKKLFLSFIFITTILFGNPDDILGDYLTPSENADSASVIRIYKKEDGKYAGKVVFLINPIFEKDINNKKPELRERSLLDFNILDDFVYDEQKDMFVNGYIYNPENGHTYHSSIKIIDNNTISVRGAVDKFLILGGTRTWHKLEE